MIVEYKDNKYELLEIAAEADSHYYGSVDCDWLAYDITNNKLVYLCNVTYEENASRIIFNDSWIEELTLRDKIAYSKYANYPL